MIKSESAPTSKIAVLHIDTGNSWRGGQNQVALLIEEQIKSEQINTFFAGNSEAPLFKKLAPIIGSTKTLSIHTIFAVVKIFFFCKKHKIQIIHAHDSNAHSMGILIATINKNIRLIVHRRVLFNRSKKSILFRYKYLSKNVSGYITVSNAIKSQLIKLGINPKIICNISDSANINAYINISKNELKTGLNLPIDKLTLCVIGHLSAEKGHATFLEALQKLPPSQLTVLIVGNGPLEPELKAKANKLKNQHDIRFLGFRDDVQKILAASDLLVVPSLSEGLGSIILEGINAGIAIVATDVGGIPETLERYTNSVLVPANNPFKLAEALKTFTKKLFCTHTNTDRHSVAVFDQQHTPKFMTKKTQDIYELVLKK